MRYIIWCAGNFISDSDTCKPISINWSMWSYDALFAIFCKLCKCIKVYDMAWYGFHWLCLTLLHIFQSNLDLLQRSSYTDICLKCWWIICTVVMYCIYNIFCSFILFFHLPCPHWFLFWLLSQFFCGRIWPRIYILYVCLSVFNNDGSINYSYKWSVMDTSLFSA